MGSKVIERRALLEALAKAGARAAEADAEAKQFGDGHHVEPELTLGEVSIGYRSDVIDLSSALLADARARLPRVAALLDALHQDIHRFNDASPLDPYAVLIRLEDAVVDLEEALILSEME